MDSPIPVLFVSWEKITYCFHIVNLAILAKYILAINRQHSLIIIFYLPYFLDIFVLYTSLFPFNISLFCFKKKQLIAIFFSDVMDPANTYECKNESVTNSPFSPWGILSVYNHHLCSVTGKLGSLGLWKTKNCTCAECGGVGIKKDWEHFDSSALRKLLIGWWKPDLTDLLHSTMLFCKVSFCMTITKEYENNWKIFTSRKKNQLSLPHKIPF